MQAGPDSGDLKIHVVGKHFNSIEVFFRSEIFYRETFPNTSYLQYGHRISIAPKNKLGTFAVFHDGGSSVKAVEDDANAQRVERSPSIGAARS